MHVIMFVRNYLEHKFSPILLFINFVSVVSGGDTQLKQDY